MAEEPPRGSYAIKYVCMYVCMYVCIGDQRTVLFVFARFTPVLEWVPVNGELSQSIFKLKQCVIYSHRNYIVVGRGQQD